MLTNEIRIAKLLFIDRSCAIYRDLNIGLGGDTYITIDNIVDKHKGELERATSTVRWMEVLDTILFEIEENNIKFVRKEGDRIETDKLEIILGIEEN